MGELRLEHLEAMKTRFKQLNWRFDEEEFWKWYDAYHYGSKALCERLREG